MTSNNNTAKNSETSAGLPPPDILPVPEAHTSVLAANDRVTPQDHWQDVRRLNLDVKLPENTRTKLPRSMAGSTVIIYPKNYPEDVETLVKLMGWEGIVDKPLDWEKITRRPKGLYIKDANATLRDLLLHNLDITTVPNRNFIRKIALCTQNEREVERLQEFIQDEQEFYDYTSRPRRTTLELLRDFPGVQIPWNLCLDLFPIMRGREFSVCNGGKTTETEDETIIRLEVLAALVEYRTIIRKPRQGLCSRYITHLPVGTAMRIGIKYPATKVLEAEQQYQRPVIAVATGTGIAPIRAYIQDRAVFHPPGPALLFFGCRNKEADFYYKNEWANTENMEVVPAFSRDPFIPEEAKPLDGETTPSLTGSKELGGDSALLQSISEAAFNYDANKNYVQHHIRKHARRGGELMREFPVICICGNSGRMPVSVRNALLEAMVFSEVVKTKEAAQEWLDDKTKVTFWQEVW